ncbi:MAG: hypothetical protein HKN06_04810 [Gammaproteobacteria bacterium]|nr:hypothetical protein [Gammaproteobacteria bacterium]
MNLRTLAGVAIAAALISGPVSAAVTNLTFVGGCPTGEEDAECFSAGNATVANVALILGVGLDSVVQVTSGYTINGMDGSADNDYNTNSGTWSISDSSITHLAFKANGYFILGRVTGTSGDWSSDITMWTPDYSSVICPAGICNPDARPYTLADFLNEGGNISDLSNVRAFSVVPIPAAAWLFASALGLLGWMRRR